MYISLLVVVMAAALFVHQSLVASRRAAEARALHARVDALQAELRGQQAELRGQYAELRGQQAELDRQHVALRDDVVDALKASRAIASDLDATARRLTAIGERLQRLSPSEPPGDWLLGHHRGELDEAAAIELGLERHPGHRGLLEAFARRSLALAEKSTEPMVQREVLVRLTSHVDRYRLRCEVADLAAGERVKQELRVLADKIVADAARRQQAQVRAQLDALEKKTDESLRKPKLTDEDSRALAQLDDAIDKPALRSSPELRARYDELSKRIIDYYASGDRQAADRATKQYNQQAIDAAREAQELFKKNDSAFESNKTSQLPLAERLGGWDPRHLFPSTSTYTSMVYSDIFQSLKPDARLALTRAMLAVPTRELRT